MKILISGASGFLGRSVLKELAPLKHEIYVIVRDKRSISRLNVEFPGIDFYHHDYRNKDMQFRPNGDFDVFLNMAWGDLDDFQSTRHLSEELPSQRRLIEDVIQAGVKSIVSLGTCLEYSKLEGEIRESDPCEPEIPYAIAKNQLRQYLHIVSKSKSINFAWIRLFYFYGPGQPDRTLFGQLLRAVNLRQNIFVAETNGLQMLDYMHVDKVAKNLVRVLLTQRYHGEVNLCSGVARTIREIVNGWIQEFDWNIQIAWGSEAQRKHETRAFWGATQKLEAIIAMESGS